MDNPLHSFKKFLSKLGNQVIESVDSDDPIIILPYRGYANDSRIYLKGRVLEDENIFRGKTASQIQNIINSFKRFETDELPNANIVITCNNQTFECTTDAEGYFTLDTAWTAPEKDLNNSWISVQYELMSLKKEDGTAITATGEVYLPSVNADYGVITDVDDTILQTHVTSLFRLRMLYATFVKNAHERLPMEGMVSLFKAFEKGYNKQRNNPVFYVSHSPWNIYDLLIEFFGIQGFPKGPLLLRDYGFEPSGAFSDHKMEAIKRILEIYPKLPFILLGDAADADADFYITIAKAFPERIKAIYIRKTRDNKNAKRIKQLLDEYANVNTILVTSSEEINRHAVEVKLLNNS